MTVQVAATACMCKEGATEAQSQQRHNRKGGKCTTTHEDTGTQDKRGHMSTEHHHRSVRLYRRGSVQQVIRSVLRPGCAQLLPMLQRRKQGCKYVAPKAPTAAACSALIVSIVAQPQTLICNAAPHADREAGGQIERQQRDTHCHLGASATHQPSGPYRFARSIWPQGTASPSGVWTEQPRQQVRWEGGRGGRQVGWMGRGDEQGVQDRGCSTQHCAASDTCRCSLHHANDKQSCSLVHDDCSTLQALHHTRVSMCTSGYHHHPSPAGAPTTAAVTTTSMCPCLTHLLGEARMP